MNLRFESRLALVTGADSGIGHSTAQTLAAEGARVIMTDIDEAKLDSSLGKLKKAVPNGDVFAFAADLTSTADVERLYSQCRELGHVSVVAHLAGARGAAGDFLTLSDDDWRETVEIDLLGAVRVCRTFIPDMLEQSYGRIVLTASENAVQPYIEESPYNACKAGIINLGKCLSKAYGKRGVHVNVVSPAFIETPMTDAMMEERAEEKGVSVEEAVQGFLTEHRPGITLQRRGQPQEVANVIAFLCSDAARFVDGSNYRVDGGSAQTAFS